MNADGLSHTRQAATAALASRVAGTRDASGYTVRIEDNLLPRADSQLARDDFDAAAGKERDGKMRAPWSSSALALNCFGPWRADPSHLPLTVAAGFDSLRFEAVCPTGLRGTPPHLDVLAEREGMVVGVESKCTEYLGEKTARFKAAYDAIQDARSAGSWFAQIAVTRSDPAAYRLLDVAQLVKHSLGLARCHGDRPITLLYLYWEPLDWMSFAPFRRHRDEIERFARAVAGDPIVAFRALSYLDLWSQWEALSEPSWLDNHVRALRNRYELEVGPFMTAAK